MIDPEILSGLPSVDICPSLLSCVPIEGQPGAGAQCYLGLAMPVRRTARAILPRLVFILLLGVFLAAPLPYRPPLFDVSGRAPFDDAPASSSAAQSRTYEFRLDRSRPDLTVRFSTRLSGGQVAFTLRDGDKSSATWGLIGRDSVQATFGFGREFRAGAYTLKVESKNARGEFRARVFGARPWQYHQKLYILLAAGALAFGLRLFVVKRRGDAAAPQAVILRYVVRLLLFGLGLSLLYPIIHETGHALPMIAFGAFSLHGSDFIGAFGHPHVSYLPGVELQPWQYLSVSYTHLRAHETVLDLVCRLLLEKKNKNINPTNYSHLNNKHKF